jgi:hypothetical protein
MFERHLSNVDFERLLAFEPGDDVARELERHASSCDLCAARLAREVQIELACVEAGKVRPTRAKTARGLIAAGVAAAAAVTFTALLLARDRAPEDVSSARSDFAASSVAAQGSQRDAWHISGSRPKYYETGIEPSSPPASGKVRFLRYIGPPSPEQDWFGTTMQMFSAEKYKGKRVRFTATVKTAGVTGQAGLWLRVDGPSHQVLAFDNMDNRPIVGTTSWTRYDVVLDV